MISLLPQEAKQFIKAGRTNVSLIKYMMVLILGVAFLAIISGAVYFILTDIKNSAEETIKTNSSKGSSYSEARNQAVSLQSSLSSARSLLDSEIIYSKLLTSIAALMPQGTVLSKVELNPKILTTPISLIVYADSTDTATNLQVNFNNSSLFSNVEFQTLSNTAQSQIAGYPVTATISLTINKAAIK